MKSERIRILKNVLVCQQGNQMQLCDIHFDQTIRQIIPSHSIAISWSKIATPDAWKKFQKHLPDTSGHSSPEALDGGFLLLMPGAIDTHVHFNTPGYEQREDFEHGSLAAASGGVTTVIDMPCTSLPPVTHVKNLQIKLDNLRRRSLVDYALWGGISGTDFNRQIPPADIIRELAAAGVAGFKAYLISGMESFTDLTYSRMAQAAAAVKTTGKPLAVHAEDRRLVKERQQELQQNGQQDWQAYCAARDVLAETTAVSQLLKISARSGCRIHIVHLSSARGVQLVQQGREEGIPFSAETCPHYLFFTRPDFANPAIAHYLKTAPPVKEETDKSRLWEALREGILEFVTTDHAGCDPHKEKSTDNFWDVYGGIPGVEHRVPFLFSEGFKKGRLNLQQTIDLLARNPAVYFRLDSRKGGLKAGKDADFALVDLWSDQTISAKDMHSKGKYTPFEGCTFSVKVTQTFLRGQPLFDGEGKALESFGYGQWIGV